MKRLPSLLLAFLLIAPALADANDELSLAIKNASYDLQFSDYKMSGEGYDKLIDEAKRHKVFMFGENHATAEIAIFAHQVYSDLSQDIPRLLVTEVGPMAARKMQSLVQNGRYREYMSRGLNLQTIPFFAFEEEVALLENACNQSHGFTDCIIGLDQEFIASAPIVYDYFKEHAPNDAALETLESFDNWSWLNPFLVGQGDGKAVNEVAKAYQSSSDPLVKTRAQQLALSYKIYKNQMGGDAAWSNEARESLMMDNFIEQLDHPDIPDLFLKFGAYHTMKGHSVTVDKALGERVDDWAKAKGWSTLNLFIDGYQGTSRDPLLGFEQDKSHFTNWSKSPFAEFIPQEGAVLFDLRKLRSFVDSEKFTKRQKMVISNYDYLLMFSTVSAATFLDGRLITRTYLAVICFIVLTIVMLLIWWLVRFIKKRRRGKR